MSETLHLQGKVRRLGNSLAFVIPAAEARKAHIQEGTDIQAEVTVGKPRLLGLLKGVIPYEPFSRAEFYNDDD